MRRRRVKPLLVGGYHSPHGTKEKRLSAAARVTFDQRGIGSAAENIRLDQNVLRKPGLVGNDLQPGDRRAPRQRQIPQATRCKIFLLEAEGDRLPWHNVRHRRAQVTAQRDQRTVRSSSPAFAARRRSVAKPQAVKTIAAPTRILSATERGNFFPFLELKKINDVSGPASDASAPSAVEIWLRPANLPSNGGRTPRC